MAITDQRYSLLSSNSRIQAPFVKVTLGDYTFGVFSQKERMLLNDRGVKYTAFNIQYPNYINQLSITKINGQVNTYSLSINYPVRAGDDPNFFEKVFSSISKTRKMKLTYGDALKPAYIYKDEVAIITKISTSFSFGSSGSFSSELNYTIEATSESALSTATSLQRLSDGQPHKPSDLITELFRNPSTGLSSTFTGRSKANLDSFIAGDDKPVVLNSKTNISALDDSGYLVSCMVPDGTTTDTSSKDVYILTIHDDTRYDRLFNEDAISGSYFKVERVAYSAEHSEAYTIDIGSPNSKDLVLDFNVSDSENYSLYYEYQKKLTTKEYVRRISADGKWVDVFAPTVTSKNSNYETDSDNQAWFTKITKFPISASITIQGLLRPAQLMTYVRLRVIFPGGQKHISSGLYLITSQRDSISASGYKTTLGLTRISGDTIDTVS